MYTTLMLTSNCIGAVHSVLTMLTLAANNVSGRTNHHQIQLMERGLMQPDSITLAGSKGSM